MKAQKITKEVIESLPSETYAIFKDGILFDTIMISEGGYISSLTDDFSHSYEHFVNELQSLYIFQDGKEKWVGTNLEDCYIILASEVKLNV